MEHSPVIFTITVQTAAAGGQGGRGQACAAATEPPQVLNFDVE